MIEIAKTYDVDFVELENCGDSAEFLSMVERLKDYDDSVVSYESYHLDAFEFERKRLFNLAFRRDIPLKISLFCKELLLQGGYNKFDIVRVEIHE